MKINGREIGEIKIRLGYSKHKPKKKGFSYFDFISDTICLVNTKRKRWKLDYHGYIESLLEHEYLHAILKKICNVNVSKTLDRITDFFFIKGRNNDKICYHSIVFQIKLFEPEERYK